LRRTGFNAALTTMTGGTSAGWVGEGKSAPFSKAAFSRLATPLGRLKLDVMCAEDAELVRSSDPDAELTIATDFAAAIIAARDAAFIDPAETAIAGVRPASVTNGAPAFASSGSTAALLDADLGRIIESLIAHGSNLEFACWVLHPITALFLARLLNTNGDRAYPGLSVQGGILLGLPAIVSGSVPHVGSPSATSICLLDAARIWLAEDPAMELALSKSAAVQFLDNPTNDITTPTPTNVVSAFQSDSVILRGTQTCNWKIADPGFAAVLNNVAD
jgi:HK97 family phage major capsid protein